MAIINGPKTSYTQLGDGMQLEITHNKDFTQSIIRSGETNIRINRELVPAKEDFVDLLIQTVKQAYRNLEVNNYAKDEVTTK